MIGTLKSIFHGLSSRDPVIGTSQEFSHISGFPRIVEAGFGFPVAPTVVRNNDSKKKEMGVNLGDVGLINTFGFTTAFNLFLPRDHPVNARVPPNFSPLTSLEPEEISTIDNYFPVGSVIVSKGVEVTRSATDPKHISCHQYQESESAVMILRDGAKRNSSPISLRSSITNHHGKKGGLVVDIDKGELVSGEGTSELTRVIFPNRLEDDPCIFVRGLKLAFGESKSHEKIYNGYGVRMQPFSPLTVVSQLKVRVPVSDDDISSFSSRDSSLADRRPWVNWIPFHPLTIVAELLISQHPKCHLALLDEYLLEDLMPKDRADKLTYRCEHNAAISGYARTIEMVLRLYDAVEKEGVLLMVKKSEKSDSKKNTRFLRFQLRSKQKDTLQVLDAPRIERMMYNLLKQGEESYWDY
ncbi:hypothetical protein D9613_001126 [Agrocybe pediades]|uniref:Uncharacterized protein n=1 Tax=Agrocybe pediades TaxID=84607 RepID=A0A8H4VU87_9AGAR|nr:hypothetical protein D9613_001126 [Agrocybe pediades]